MSFSFQSPKWPNGVITHYSLWLYRDGKKILEKRSYLGLKYTFEMVLDKLDSSTTYNVNVSCEMLLNFLFSDFFFGAFSNLILYR